MAHSRGGRNPIYSWKHFADYRSKVTQKESENEDPTWPLYLEDAFLDALLLIPLMGRQKFSSKGVLYGRNMLLTEYLWICHWLLHPPHPGEIVPVGKAREKHPMYRGRKQVSSHIQVLKGFFLTHPIFHFLFPAKKDEKEEDRRRVKEDEGEIKSFKNNRVLIALADGRLPDERPNYDYFARLLAGDSEVFVRPKTCWIYVSSSEVTLSEDSKRAFAADGTCLEADIVTPDGTRLECKGDYPHLLLNSNKETRRDLDRSRTEGEPPKHLLHEYTRTLTQKESSSVKEISARWDDRFPDLRDKLVAALDDTHPSHERTSRCVIGPCDTVHLDVVLDLHATSQFPSGTHLEGAVELQICRPELANHRWRSFTSIVKPRELELGDSEPPFWNCATPCEITGRQRDVIVVPFPATSWANTFIRLASYVTAERERRERRSGRDSSRPKRDDGDDDKHKPSGKVYTPLELLSQVAMYQEIWSAPNDGSKKPNWTRRSIILWTFSNVHSKTDEKGKTSTVPPGTNWRFLTKIDPTSQYHQQRAYVTGSPSLCRDHVMSPNPGYTHHINATMHENFSSAYDAPTITLQGQQQQHTSHLAGLNLLDTFSPGGLATPPPTASLSSSYAHSFDSATIASSTDSLHNNSNSNNHHHHVSFLSDTSGTDSSHGTVLADHHADPFLAGLGAPGYDDADCDPSLQAWASAATGGLHGLDPVAQWATTYVDSQQGSLAWADTSGIGAGSGGGAGADLTESSHWHDASRDHTPWTDGKDSFWATGAAGSSSNEATGELPGEQQQSHDPWATSTSSAWLQSIAAVADANSNMRDAWDDAHVHHILASSTSSVGSATSSALHLHPSHATDADHHLHHHQQQLRHDDIHNHQQGHDQDCVTSMLQHGGGGGEDFSASIDGGAAPTATTATNMSPMRQAGQKRARAEEEDGDDAGDGGAAYPCHSIRKLTHSSSTRAPAAVMLESPQHEDEAQPPFL
ncbi:uncharacterized protein JN550_010005 [Neoarthrinium moseri]|uniref:uncharacterized protein n=1 Tax=Neoarthrinium moseri TaxID=1658444 RepID=UPI001FDD5430|nr:uncharacterized protein JN550_010005 [Neoarthrinium moseri]KAI1862858.1 hypothetical protein JN550_010005 [Neoarthrinium moseri]